jgi:hypothetical protein
MPLHDFDRERAQQAAARMRVLLAAQGPRVTEQEAQQNWERLKRELDAEDDARIRQDR